MPSTPRRAVPGVRWRDCSSCRLANMSSYISCRPAPPHFWPRPHELVAGPEVVGEHAGVHAGTFRHLADGKVAAACFGQKLTPGGQEQTVDVARGAGHGSYCTTV